MWRLLRRKKERFVRVYSDDVIAATGKLSLQAEFIRYGITSGITWEMDDWLQMMCQHYQKSKMRWQTLPPICFFKAKTEKQPLPLLGLLAASHDSGGRDYPFMLMRLLNHPLAREFTMVAPWLYRETSSAMLHVATQNWQGKTLKELYKQLDNLRWENIRLTRRHALEAIVQQLRYMSFDHFWQASHLPGSALSFMQHMTLLLRDFGLGKYSVLRLPLLHQYDLAPMIIFWLQLIESLLGDKLPANWEIYWHASHETHRAALIFSLKPVPHREFLALIDQTQAPSILGDAFQYSTSQNVIDTEVQRLMHDPSISMLKLLTRWAELFIGY